ncbi:MAG: MFS transporter [Chloroflexi bacterium]|nr:MFS transporter [Chloroflexota bacterium]
MRQTRRLVYACSALRSFGYGFLSVLLGLYLASLGFDPVHVGLLFTLALVGGGLVTLLLSLWADAFGRKRSLLVLSALMALGGLVLAFWPRYPQLLTICLLGAMNPLGGKDRGSFVIVEQALLPVTGSPQERNRTFANYNLVANLAASVGALAGGIPALLEHWLGLAPLRGFQVMFLLYSLTALFMALLYTLLSSDVEVKRRSSTGLLLPRLRSRRRIGTLAGLFAVDSFAGGFVIQSFIAYWLNLRFGLEASTLSLVLFGSGVLSSLSFPVAAFLADRLGLVNVMVFTHLPSNLLLMAIPFGPNPWVAIGLLLVREALSQMDVPTRQSYIMAIVEEDERVTAAGLTTLSRTAAQSSSPSLAGYLVQALGLATPFLLSGTLKICYDLALYFSFRRIRPPEEVT